MTYLDTSLVLASVLGEDVRPDEGPWSHQGLLTSRLTEYEARVRLNAYGRLGADGAQLAATLAFIDVVELSDEVVGR